MSSTSPRSKLLDAAVEHATQHGLSDTSLRSLASELGTSHRMLIHHFGSKGGLWAAIVREVERRQRESLRTEVPDPSASFARAAWAWWKHISDESLWPNERLFFEIYGQALQGRIHTATALDGVIASWLEPIAALGAAAGIDPASLDRFARLSLAVVRGLLLDLLATRDVAAVDAAMQHWIMLNETYLRDLTNRHTTSGGGCLASRPS